MVIFDHRFFGIKTASSVLVIFEMVKLSMRIIPINYGAIEGHLEGQRC